MSATRRGRPPGRRFAHTFQVALDGNCDDIVHGLMAELNCGQNEAVRVALRLSTQMTITAKRRCLDGAADEEP
jgi:hypothetical protein